MWGRCRDFLRLERAVLDGALGLDAAAAELDAGTRARARGCLRCGEERARALTLGFREFYFTSPEAPVLSRDGTRQYVWAVLDENGVVPPGTDDDRIRPATDGEPVSDTEPAKNPTRTADPLPDTTEATIEARRLELERVLAGLETTTKQENRSSGEIES